MSSCRALIRKHLILLEPGEIFTTRDLLSYGKRSTVDVATHLLVKTGYLTRLAFGVFVVTHSSKPSYSAEEIVSRKAIAFGKEVYAHAKSLTKQQGRQIKLFIKPNKDTTRTICAGGASSTSSIGLPVQRQEEGQENGTDGSQQEQPEEMKETKPLFFSCLSSSSSFIFRRGIMHDIDLAMVRYCCAKLLKHGDSNVGKAIRALVALGWSQISLDIVSNMLQQLNYKEQAELRMANAWMPSWLSDRLITEQSAIASANRFRASRA